MIKVQQRIGCNEQWHIHLAQMLVRFYDIVLVGEIVFGNGKTILFEQRGGTVQAKPGIHMGIVSDGS
ncbi:hypothetical protein ES703_121096 [subsurface metagenome]